MIQFLPRLRRLMRHADLEVERSELSVTSSGALSRSFNRSSILQRKCKRQKGLEGKGFHPFSSVPPPCSVFAPAV